MIIFVIEKKNSRKIDIQRHIWMIQRGSVRRTVNLGLKGKQWQVLRGKLKVCNGSLV